MNLVLNKTLITTRAFFYRPVMSKFLSNRTKGINNMNPKSNKLQRLLDGLNHPKGRIGIQMMRTLSEAKKKNSLESQNDAKKEL